MHDLEKKQIYYTGGLAYVQQKFVNNVGRPGYKHIFEEMGLNASQQSASPQWELWCREESAPKMVWQAVAGAPHPTQNRGHAVPRASEGNGPTGPQTAALSLHDTNRRMAMILLLHPLVRPAGGV